MDVGSHQVSPQLALQPDGGLPAKHFHVALDCPRAVVALDHDSGFASLQDLWPDLLACLVLNPESPNLGGAPVLEHGFCCEQERKLQLFR